MPARAISVFLAMTFLITWGIVGFYAPARRLASSWFAEIRGSHPIEWVVSGDAAMVGDSSDHVAEMKAALAGLAMEEPQ